MSTSSHNPELQPSTPPPRNEPIQPDAPDFVETPDAPEAPAGHEPIPPWLFLICGVALFLAGSSFTGWHPGLYDSGPGAPIVASTGPSTTVSAPLDPMQLGKQVYQGNCANCHQGTGAGQPGSYPPLAGSEYVNGDVNELYAIMLHGLQGPLTVEGGSYGTQQMPGWGTALSDEKIAAVMTYIRGSWGNTSAAVATADVTAARAKFASHADAYTAAELKAIAPAAAPAK
jgi:mono/diheme cytochrome c family protein